MIFQWHTKTSLFQQVFLYRFSLFLILAVYQCELFKVWFHFLSCKPVVIFCKCFSLINQGVFLWSFCALMLASWSEVMAILVKVWSHWFLPFWSLAHPHTKLCPWKIQTQEKEIQYESIINEIFYQETYHVYKQNYSNIFDHGHSITYNAEKFSSFWCIILYINKSYQNKNNDCN